MAGRDGVRPLRWKGDEGRMHKIDIWTVLPFLLPVISYVIGVSRNKLKVPAAVQKLLGNPEVIEIIVKGIGTAQTMKGKTDEEKREFVRAWAKSELFRVLGQWLPDSAVNFLIEHTITKQKGG